MKKLLALLVMVAMLLPSCQKINDRIDGLEDRIDQIEGTQIATINQQIEVINTTLPQLRETDAELKEYIQSLLLQRNYASMHNHTKTPLKKALL